MALLSPTGSELMVVRNLLCVLLVILTCIQGERHVSTESQSGDEMRAGTLVVRSCQLPHCAGLYHQSAPKELPRSLVLHHARSATQCTQHSTAVELGRSTSVRTSHRASVVSLVSRWHPGVVC